MYDPFANKISLAALMRRSWRSFRIPYPAYCNKKRSNHKGLFSKEKMMGFSSPAIEQSTGLFSQIYPAAQLHGKFGGRFESHTLLIVIKKEATIKVASFFMAERMGFEPMWLLAKRFSRPPRYDRFDTSPYLLKYIITVKI